MLEPEENADSIVEAQSRLLKYFSKIKEGVSVLQKRITAIDQRDDRQHTSQMLRMYKHSLVQYIMEKKVLLKSMSSM